MLNGSVFISFVSRCTVRFDGLTRELKRQTDDNALTRATRRLT